MHERVEMVSERAVPLGRALGRLGFETRLQRRKGLVRLQGIAREPRMVDSGAVEAAGEEDPESVLADDRGEARAHEIPIANGRRPDVTGGGGLWVLGLSVGRAGVRGRRAGAYAGGGGGFAFWRFRCGARGFMGCSARAVSRTCDGVEYDTGPVIVFAPAHRPARAPVSRRIEVRPHFGLKLTGF